MKKILKYCFVFLIILSPLNKLWAYANFIAYGYTSCLTCHYNALGNGPLNDYGRAVSATAISGRLFHSSKISEEELGENSNFFFGKLQNNKWIKPSINLRGMRYDKNIFLKNRQTRNIPMQAEGDLVLKPTGKDNFFFSGNYGYAPTPESTKKSSQKIPNVISREHYFQWVFYKSHRIYLGLMDKAFGIRIPDHVAFSRSVTGLAQNDQSHGLIYHFTSKEFEFATNIFVGNLYQDKDLRQKGGSLTLDYEIAPQTRVGFSSLTSQSKYLKYLTNSIHLKAGFGEGASLITEVGNIQKSPINSDIDKTSGVYSFSQAMLRIVRGLHLLTSYEYYKSDISSGKVNSNYRFIIGLQYFPIQRLEFRFDLANSRIVSPTTVIPDSWDLMSQVHLWF
jgi:hypothetical protein